MSHGRKRFLSGPWAARLPDGAAGCLAVCIGGLALAAVGVQRGFDIGAGYAAVVVAAFAAGALPALVVAARQLPGAPFGAANAVTLTRGALVALVFGLLLAEPVPSLAWFAVAVASVALLLDGVDGRLARTHGTTSEFGARLDMETDALATLVLAGLVWHFDKAGLFVLGSGLLRYVFVAAAQWLPFMERPLPPSRRRKTVCVVQIAALLLCLSPPVTPPLSEALAALALAALVVSFAIDVAWLAARRSCPMPA